MTDWEAINSNSSGYTVDVRQNSGAAAKQTLMVGTAVTGLVRIEWLQARLGQVIPTNWSWVQAWQYMATGSFMPLGYQVDDAQNLICGMAMAGEYEWLLLYEHDNLPAPDALVRLAEYMKRGDVPIVSGLYFTRSIPSEPLIYRGMGTLAYEDFDVGDLVWANGVPTGFLLVHMSIIREMWNASEPYMIGATEVRRVFETPSKAWFDPETAQYNTQNGTSDLAWCQRIVSEGFLASSGWSEYQNLEHPFLVDTNIICEHIDNNLAGTQYPPGGVRDYWAGVRARRAVPLHPEHQPEPLGVTVSDGVTTDELIGA